MHRYVLFIVTVLSSSVSADALLTFDGRGSEELRSIAVRDGKVAMQSGRNTSMLYDERARRVTVVDHARRSYFTLDQRSMEQQAAAVQQRMQSMQAQMAPMMEQMRQQLQAVLDDPDIPETQKDAVRQQFERTGQAAGGAGAPAMPGMGSVEPLQAQPTGQRERIAGIDCEVHRLTRGGRALREVCVARHEDVGIARADYATLRGLFGFMRELGAGAARSVGAVAAPAALPGLDGIPLRSNDLASGDGSRLRAVSTDALEASGFAPPDGYREHQPPGRF